MPGLRARCRCLAGLLAVWLVLALADILRPPADQFLGEIYVRWIVIYQDHLETVAPLPARCRFIPTCSEYSLLAVRRHGLAKGLHLTVRRLLACHSAPGYDIPDPVPP
ncbi:MAG: membrane protein insertion efficiency factor YidD [Acidobacteria bacterium]|nr:membrane protein insertion efficiency factor YidD [Acidobacteriota bacterium]